MDALVIFDVGRISFIKELAQSQEKIRPSVVRRMLISLQNAGSSHM